MIVTPKSKRIAMAECYGEQFGVHMETNLDPKQKWIAKKDGRYWWLSRKGSPTRLRLTGAALRRLFELKEEA